MTRVAMICLCAGLARAQTAALEIIESAPGGFDQSQMWGVSADGRTLIGWTGAEVDGVVGTFGYRIVDGVREVLTEILDRDVRAISGDGTVVIGQGFLERPDDPGNFDLTGWVWSEGNGLVDLFSRFSDEFSYAWDVSSDGASVVGMTNFFIDFNGGGEFSDAFIATPAGVVSTLSHLPGMFRAEATGVSGDGSIIAGYEMDFDFVRFPVYWDMDNDGIVRQLRIPAGSLGSDIPLAMSDSGRFIAGISLQENNGFGDFREDLVLWDLEGEESVRIVAQTPEGFLSANPSFVSDDGRTIIGTLDRFGFFDNPEGAAFIWREGIGLMTLEQYLLDEHGLDTLGWRLRTARDATPDGTTIVGHTIEDSFGQMLGYAVRIGGACEADVDGDGDADADDFFGFLDGFAGGDLGTCDIDGDRDCDADDFFAYLDLFSRGC